MKRVASAILVCLFSLLYFHEAHAGSCESGHWIQEVLAEGKLLKLEDGTLWEVAEIDQIDSALWLPMSEVVLCDDKIINTDDNETVEVTQLR